MQNESRGHKNLMEIVDEHMKGDVGVRCRNVYESNSNNRFNEEFKKRIHTYWKNKDREGLKDIDKATLRDMYYDFEL